MILVVALVLLLTESPQPVFGEGCQIPNAENFVVTPLSDTYANGEIVELSCSNRNHVLDGPTTRECIEGSFSPEILNDSCKPKITCSLPNRNGLVVTPLSKTYDIGAVITLSCNDGFELLGPSTKECQSTEIDGKVGASFSLDKMVCRKMPTCEFPKIRPGLSLSPKKDIYVIGEEVTISCAKGYELTVPAISHCKLIEKDMFIPTSYHTSFSPPIPFSACSEIPKCSSPRKQSGLIVSPMEEEYGIGDEIDLSCEDGYLLAGESRRRCQRKSNYATFAPQIRIGVCEKKLRCSTPRADGLIVEPLKRSYNHDEKINISCKEGFKLKMPSSTTCGASIDNLGEFSPAIRNPCEKIVFCEAPKENGLVLSPSKSHYEVGENVTLSCEENYEYDDDAVKSTTCERNWDSARFDLKRRSICSKKPTCDSPKREEGLLFSPEKDEYAVGDVITLSCEDGYILAKESTSVCNRTSKHYSWSRDRAEFTPSLRKACQEKPRCDIDNFPSAVKLSPSKSSYDVGASVNVSCEDDYELVGPSRSSCVMRQGKFKDRVIYWAEFSSDLNETTCLRRLPCRLPESDGLIIQPMKLKYDFGDEIEIACMDGFVQKIPRISVCGYSDFYSRYGRFDTDVEHACEKIVYCEALTMQGVIMTPSKTFYEVGEAVTFSCGDNFESIEGAKSSAICTRRENFARFDLKKWERICQKKSGCYPYLDRRLSLSPEKQYYEPGENVSVSCKEGFELIGSNVTTCRTMPSFRPGYFFPTLHDMNCRKILTCSPIMDQEGLIITPKKESYALGEEIVLSCEDKYEFVGNNIMYGATRKCVRDGSPYHSYTRFSPMTSRRVCRKKRLCTLPKEEGMIVSPQKEFYEIGDTITVECASKTNDTSAIIPMRSTCKEPYMFGGIVPFLTRKPSFKPAVELGFCTHHTSIAIPTCYPPDIKGLILTPLKIEYGVGEMVVISCQTGYTHVGAREAICAEQMGYDVSDEESANFFPVLDENICQQNGFSQCFGFGIGIPTSVLRDCADLLKRRLFGQ